MGLARAFVLSFFGLPPPLLPVPASAALTVTQVVGNDHTPHKFATFAVASISGIGDLPDTVMDRSVVIRTRRRAEGQKVKPFRSRRNTPDLHELRDRIRAWTLPLLENAASLEPEMPVEDRAANTWEPLVIIADLAAGRWPRLARIACARMVAAEVAAEEDHPSGARILADIHESSSRSGRRTASPPKTSCTT